MSTTDSRQGEINRAVFSSGALCNARTGKLAEVPGCGVGWRVARHVAVEGTSEWGNVGAAAGAERRCWCIGGLWVSIYRML